MIEIVLIAVLSFGGGWWTGHKNVSVDCKVPALIEANCPKELPQLSNDSFGATTMEVIELAGQYKRCQAAATSK